MYDEAIDAGSLAVLEDLVLTVAEYGVVVAHEHDGSTQTSFPCISNHLDCGDDVDAVLQSLCVCFLDGRAVCNGVGEGHAEFDDIGTASLHGEHDIGSLLGGRETGSNICDQGRL
jgi:hypothetical protein